MNLKHKSGIKAWGREEWGHSSGLLLGDSGFSKKGTSQVWGGSGSLSACFDSSCVTQLEIHLFEMLSLKWVPSQSKLNVSSLHSKGSNLQRISSTQPKIRTTGFQRVLLLSSQNSLTSIFYGSESKVFQPVDIFSLTAGVVVQRCDLHWNEYISLPLELAFLLSNLSLSSMYRLCSLIWESDLTATGFRASASFRASALLAHRHYI